MNTTYGFPFRKKVTVGCAGSVNCVEFTAMFSIGGSWPDGFHHIQMQAPSVYLAGNLTKIWQFSTHDHHFHNYTDTTRHIPVAMGTEDGRYVIGVYSPHGQDTVQQEIYGTHHLFQNDDSFAGSTTMFNIVFTIRKPAHTKTFTYKTFLCVGSLHLVKDCMTKVVRQHPHI